MEKKLKEAIEVIENAGGFVMLPGEYDLKSESEDEIHAREQEEFEKWQKEREKQREEMRKDFDEMLGSKNFSVSAVENMVHGHGFDLDDLEELIHEYY